MSRGPRTVPVRAELSTLVPLTEFAPGTDAPIRVPESWLYTGVEPAPDHPIVVEARERGTGARWHELCRGKFNRRGLTMRLTGTGQWHEVELIHDGNVVTRLKTNAHLKYEWRIVYVKGGTQ